MHETQPSYILESQQDHELDKRHTPRGRSCLPVEDTSRICATCCVVHFGTDPIESSVTDLEKKINGKINEVLSKRRQILDRLPDHKQAMRFRFRKALDDRNEQHNFPGQ